MGNVAQRALARRGQATVEFAAALAILIVVTLAIFEFGFAMYDQITLSAAARIGARAGSLAGLSASQADTAAQQAVQAAAGQLLDCPIASMTADYGQTTQGQMTVAVSCTYQPATAVLGGSAFILTARGLEPIQP